MGQQGRQRCEGGFGGDGFGLFLTGAMTAAEFAAFPLDNRLEELAVVGS